MLTRAVATYLKAFVAILAALLIVWWEFNREAALTNAMRENTAFYMARRAAADEAFGLRAENKELRRELDKLKRIK